MKSTFHYGLALFLIAFVPIRAELILQPNDVLALCGDSITQQKIYTVDIEDYLLMCQPIDGLRIVQLGWAGEKTSSFAMRINCDLLPFKPTVVTTCYGMNDGSYRAMDQDIQSDFSQSTQAVIDKLKAAGVRNLIIGSPSCVDTKTFKRLVPDVYNHTLDSLRGIAQDLAQKNGVGFVDIYTPMMDVMVKAQAANGPDYVFIGADGIHPGAAGHLVMAYAFLKALGCDGAIGTITVDLGTAQATGTPGQKVDSFANGTVSLTSSRYPFCFHEDPAKPSASNVGVLRYLPFSDDLNRYILVVKGLKGSKAKVTWGKDTQEFTAADLEKGVNLPAAFITNPFSDQFSKVESAVQSQQALETPLIQQLLHAGPATKAMLPDQAAAFDSIRAAGLKKDQGLLDVARALVVPIRHTIHIESEP